MWSLLDAWLLREYRTADGRVLRVACTGVDSGGHFTKAVYEYCGARFMRHVFALRGAAGEGKPLASRPVKSGHRRCRLVTVGTHAGKELLYARLRIEVQGPGFCHFPQGREAAWFDQLTAETCYTKYVKGFPTRVWGKPDHVRNEALDCRVYAMAAFDLCRLDLNALAKALEKETDADAATPEPEAKAAAPAGAEPAAKIVQPSPVQQMLAARRAGRQPGGFVNSWR